MHFHLILKVIIMPFCFCFCAQPVKSDTMNTEPMKTKVFEILQNNR